MSIDKKDYIPKPDEDFDAWEKGLVTQATANATAWGIPTTETAALTASQTNWAGAFAVGGKGQKTLRTSQQTKAKNVARKSFEKTIRTFVKRWITGNTSITDAQRTALRVTIPSTSRTHEKVPTSVPNVTIEAVKGNTLEFNYSKGTADEGKSHRGKPAHTHGMKIYYKLGDPAPASPDDCNKSTTVTKSPYLITFAPIDAAKKVYCYCCWVNNREQEGPLTQMLTAVVPV